MKGFGQFWDCAQFMTKRKKKSRDNRLTQNHLNVVIKAVMCIAYVPTSAMGVQGLLFVTKGSATITGYDRNMPCHKRRSITSWCKYCCCQIVSCIQNMTDNGCTWFGINECYWISSLSLKIVLLTAEFLCVTAECFARLSYGMGVCVCLSICHTLWLY